MRFILLFLAFLIVNTAQSQMDYRTGVGVRAGFDQGLTVKHFIGSQDAIEGILSWRYRGFVVTGLWERHHNAFGVEHLFWYYGAGAHVGFWRYYNNHPWLDEGDRSGAVLGIDGIVGIEYNLADIPIGFSLDYKPAFNLVGSNYAMFDGGAISVRYLIR